MDGINQSMENRLNVRSQLYFSGRRPYDLRQWQKEGEGNDSGPAPDNQQHYCKGIRFRRGPATGKEMSDPATGRNGRGQGGSAGSPGLSSVGRECCRMGAARINSEMTNCNVSIIPPTLFRFAQKQMGNRRDEIIS